MALTKPINNHRDKAMARCTGNGRYNLRNTVARVDYTNTQAIKSLKAGSRRRREAAARRRREEEELQEEEPEQEEPKEDPRSAKSLTPIPGPPDDYHQNAPPFPGPLHNPNAPDNDQTVG